MADIKKNLINNKKAMGLRTMILNIVLFMLVLLLVLGFATQLINLNNPSSPILNDNQYGLNKSFNSLNSALGNVSSVANAIENQTQSSNPDPTSYVFLIFRGAFEVPISMLAFAFGSLTSIQTILFNITNNLTFGGLLLLVINLLIAGLTFTLIFLVIKFIRSGESER